MPTYSAAAYCCFDSSCSNKKITHLTIFSSSEFSSSNNIKNSSNNIKSRQSLREKSFQNGKGKKSSVSENKNLVSIMVVKSSSVKEKPLWKKWIFGSKKFRSIVLLHVICIVYGKL